MDRAELDRYVRSAFRSSVTVDARELPDLPGLVRIVTIERAADGYVVRIAFDLARFYVDGNDEGPVGPVYRASYPSLDVLVPDLEAFLGAPIDRWINRTRTPLEPTGLDDPRRDDNLLELRRQAHAGTIARPSAVPYELDEPVAYDDDPGEEPPPEPRRAWICHRDGSGDLAGPDPSAQLAQLLDELDDPSPGSVSVGTSDFCALVAHHDGRVVFTRRHSAPPRHQLAMPREAVIRLWLALIAGDLAAIEREPWLPGSAVDESD